jgi:single-stranded DNA-binding protein
LAEGKNEFRSIVGFVQFPPKEGTAAGKTVRNITVRQTGIHAQEALRVSATVWDSHEDVELNEGDLVAIEGKYTVNKRNDKDGNPVTYHNLSVSKVVVLGNGNSGQPRSAVANATPADESDDDLPF